MNLLFSTARFSLIPPGKNNPKGQFKMKYVYKIVAAIIALAAVPLAFFSDIFYYKASSTALQLLGYITQMMDSSAMDDILAQTGGTLPEAIGDSVSVYDIISLVMQTGFSSGDFTISEELNGFVMSIVTFAVILILVIICAIVTAVLAIVVKNNRKVIYSSIIGTGLSVMLTYAFEAISEPLLNGDISLSSLTGFSMASLIAEVEEISLTSMFWFIPVAFVAVIVWTVLYNATLPEKEKKERKLMLGEADE